MPPILSSKYVLDEETGCWNWIRALSHSGYAQFTAKEGKGRKSYRAHRYIYELLKNKIPEGLVLDHLCRNKKCVNPEHLEVVTIAENTRRGLSTKLTKLDIIKIKSLYLSGEYLQEELGLLFGIGQYQISRIINNKSWVAA